MTDIPRVIFSFDFEIGWGDVTNPRWRLRQRKGVYTKLRRVLPRLLRLMDDCAIPATWAAVGAMFDAPAQRDFSHLPQRWRDVVGSVLGEAEAESFSGADLFEMVLAAKQRHAIACHSYSHVPFDADGMTGRVVAADLTRFAAAISRYGLRADTLIFPENREAHYDALKQAGYRLARVSPLRPVQGRLAYLASTLVVPPPLAFNQMHESGILRHHGSMLFADHAQSWRLPLVKWRFRLGMKSLLRSGDGVLHLWAHPFNFAESDGLMALMTATLQDLARSRDAGRLAIVTM